MNRWMVGSQEFNSQNSATNFNRVSCAFLHVCNKFPQGKKGKGRGTKPTLQRTIFYHIFGSIEWQNSDVLTWFCSLLLLDWFFTWLQMMTAAGMIVKRSYTCSFTNRCSKNMMERDLTVSLLPSARSKSSFCYNLSANSVTETIAT